MKRHLIALLVVPTLLTYAYRPADACIWDNDTLLSEKRRFPHVFDLITGTFLRHSDDYYRWRITDRTKRIAAKPRAVRLYDDLAVAYSKLGMNAKAVATMLAKNKIKPGLYETHANLGTFYMSMGKMKKGLEHIKKAIKINPKAHFGREVFQLRLVEYIQHMRPAGMPLNSRRVMKDLSGDGALTRAVRNPRYKRGGFWDFLKARKHSHKKALKGVLGMMKFADHRSPALLEVLGDLLLEGRRHRLKDAKRLAAMAYLKASFEVKGAAAKKAYVAKAKQALQGQRLAKFDTLAIRLKGALRRAGAYFKLIEANEKRWIKQGRNVDRQFRRKYYRKRRRR